MKTLTRAMAFVLLCTPLAHAQTEKPTPPAFEKLETPLAGEQKPPDPRRLVSGSARFDITITDTAAGKPITKTVSLNVAAGGSGSIRTTGQIQDFDPKTPLISKPVPLNVDVKGIIVMANGQIRAQVVVEYQPYVENVPRLPSLITASSTTEFASGVKTLILQAADPMSDRKTTIEVTATMLK